MLFLAFIDQSVFVVGPRGARLDTKPCEDSSGKSSLNPIGLSREPTSINYSTSVAVYHLDTSHPGEPPIIGLSSCWFGQ